MGKMVRKALIIVLFLVFLCSAGGFLLIYGKYRKAEKIYGNAAMQYTKEADQTDQAAGNGADAAKQAAPITVDFDALLAVNDGIEGWIYCEGTPINYPILHGTDNSYYLKHAYDGTYLTSGSIFIDAKNSADFQDSNTVIYGHHMKNGTMFHSLADWADQDFYEEHPVMWLLTPQQDYRIVLFSGYLTSAYSDSYMIYPGPCAEFTEYLDACREASDFQADVGLPEDGRYVMLSTCEYEFEDARYVLHGLLEPVGF